MFSPSQQHTFTTAYLNGEAWNLDYYIGFTHSSEVQLQASLDGKGAIDLNIDEFVGLIDRQRRKTIAKLKANDQKKETKLQVFFTAKEKKEAEKQAKLAEKEKEKEEKAKAKGKKKANDGSQVLALSTMDQGSEMQARS